MRSLILFFVCSTALASSVLRPPVIFPNGQKFPSEPVYRELAEYEARRHGVEPALFLGLIAQESSWRRNITSPSGAMGLGQLMRKTALWACPDLFPTYWSDIYEPRANLKCSARYLSWQLRDFKRCERCALAAYNQGPGLTARNGGEPYTDQAKRYIPRVQYYARIYRRTL